MPFLRTRDYPNYIQTLTLNQITHNSLSNRISAEEDAIEEIKEYLRQKYDTDGAFADTLTFDPTATYDAYNLTELTAPAYVVQSVSAVNQQVLFTDNKIYLCIQVTAPLWQAQNYVAGNKVLYTDGNYYVCILNTTTDQAPGNATYWTVVANQGPGNTAYWTALGWNLSLNYIAYPYPPFDINCYYPAGTIRYWKGKIYKSIIVSSELSDNEKIQYDLTTEYPYPNIKPDDAQYGIIQWGTGVPYSVTGINMTTTASTYSVLTNYTTGQLVTIGTQLYQAIANNGPGSTVISPGTDIITWQPVTWTAGDNRNRMLVQQTIHVTLYNLHNQIAPQNIPILREKNHIRAIKWCEDVRSGNVVVDLLSMPVKQPGKGGRILIGGRPKYNNKW
jgi:hypothetical protein